MAIYEKNGLIFLACWMGPYTENWKDDLHCSLINQEEGPVQVFINQVQVPIIINRWRLYFQGHDKEVFN